MCRLLENTERLLTKVGESTETGSGGFLVVAATTPIRAPSPTVGRRTRGMARTEREREKMMKRLQGQKD